MITEQNNQKEQEFISSIWPQWQIVKLLGKGSYGSVYEAIRSEHNVESRAAVKIISIPQELSETESLRSEGMSEDKIRSYYQGLVNSFVKEIQLMESLKGTQNIVSVEDYKVVERENGFGWDILIRMELLTPFIKHIGNKTLNEPEVVKLGMDICSALELCNKRGIIHRDIKPENIFVNDFGDYKLGDFGIARQLDESSEGLSQKGTYNYMAPEVAQGGKYDPTVDIYSLGIVMFRFLNKNRLPFINSEQEQIDHEARKRAVQRRLGGENLPPPSEASPPLADIILKACDPDPLNRFKSAQEMRRELMQQNENNYVEDDLDKTVMVRQAPLGSSDPEPKSPEGKKKKRSFLPIVIAIVILAILAGGAYFVLNGNDDKESSNNDTQEESADNTVEDSDNAKESAETTDKQSDDQSGDISEVDTRSEQTDSMTEETAEDEVMTKEKYDEIITQFASKYSGYDVCYKGVADSYRFIYADDDDIPELVVSNGVAFDVVSLELKENSLMQNIIGDCGAKLLYVEKGNRILANNNFDTGMIEHHYDYYTKHPKGYFYPDGGSAIIFESEKGMLYNVDARSDTTENVFEDFMHRYGELTEISLEYEDMYRSIPEAGEALWNEVMENNG